MKSLFTFLARKFKQFPYFGRQRFWILYWAYKITGWHIRHEEWPFILKFLPGLHNEKQSVSIYDVGCSRNLICYEFIKRGYKIVGADIEEPEFKYQGIFSREDITRSYYTFNEIGFDFVTCISVLEHIGNDGKGDFADQKKALENMCASLKIGGRLLLTTPTKEFAQGHIWHGFTWADIAEIMPKTMRSIESTEHAGQLCMALERVA